MVALASGGPFPLAESTSMTRKHRGVSIWQAARAKQIARPEKRVIVFAKPVNGHERRTAAEPLRDMHRTFVSDETCEGCGHHLCSCAPPSAPVAEAPKAKAAQAFVVGQRVRVVTGHLDDLVFGTEHVIAQISDRAFVRGLPNVRLQGGFWWAQWRFEPAAPAPVAEGEWVPPATADAESCARAALEVHARQVAP